MKINRSACDEQRLAAFLDERTTPDEQAWLESHLETCFACRERLHRAAADNDSWDDAARLLRDEPFDAEPLSGWSDSAESGDAGGDGDSDWATQHAAVASDGTQRVLDALAPTDDPRMLGRLGGYEILGVIGAGGMGVVLKGFDASLNRYVAIKVLAPHLANHGAARRRFSREAQAAAAVVHPHVVAIHAVSAEARPPFLVMPYLRGMSLQRRIDEHGPLSVAEVLRIGAQTASGLAAAHAQGLVHRDIKPANILLEEGVERVAITDFGLARAIDDATTTRSGVIAGTPQYMSPEQARGEAIDHRSDLFSLGSVMYAMCTGRSPFRAETTFGILRRITDAAPRPIRELNAEIPAWLCRVVDRLLTKDPRERYASAEEVAELLEHCLAHWQQPTRVPLPPELRASRRRRFRIAGAAALLVLVPLAIAGWIVWGQAERWADSGETRSNEAAVNIQSSDPAAVGSEARNAASEREPSSADNWGDDAANELLEIEHDLERLERASDSLLGPLPP